MTVALDGAPEEFEELARELERRGYETRQGRVDSARFGNQIVGFERGRLRLRMFRDRGQWFIDAACPRSDDWFPSYVWTSMLDNEVWDGRPQSPAEAADGVWRRLDQFERAAAGRTRPLRRKLVEWRAACARQRRIYIARHPFGEPE